MIQEETVEGNTTIEEKAPDMIELINKMERKKPKMHNPDEIRILYLTSPQNLKARLNPDDFIHVGDESLKEIENILKEVEKSYKKETIDMGGINNNKLTIE